MDPLQWTMYILGGLLGGGIVCFICKWPLKKINEETIGELFSYFILAIFIAFTLRLYFDYP